MTIGFQNEEEQEGNSDTFGTTRRPQTHGVDTVNVETEITSPHALSESLNAAEKAPRVPKETQVSPKASGCQELRVHSE